MPQEDGNMASSFSQPSQLGSTHFINLFRAPCEASIAEIVQIAGHFPRFVDEDSYEELNSLITIGELEGTLKWFKKDKSPGPDGWCIEFFLAFYDLIGTDLLKVVEECRTIRHMHDAINTNFIALIPKSDSLTSFNDFLPISLCSNLYKINTIIKYLSNQHYYKIKMGLGEGTNNYAEFITLRHLLHFALAHSCNNIQIFGDSQIIINWFNNKNRCHAHSLRNILDEIMVYKAQFNSIIYQHIYKEYNEAADKLSKEATTQLRGLWMILEQHGADQH